MRKELRERGYTLRLLDLIEPAEVVAGERAVVGNINDSALLLEATAGVGGVLHLAGCTSDAAMDAQIEGNIVGAANVFEAGRLNDVERVVFASSHHVVAHPAALPHSLHGPAQRHPWILQEHSPFGLSMHLDYAADADWPWAFADSQTFSVRDDTLAIHLAVYNRDRRAMPAGLGWHPYFRGAAMVEHDAAYLWPHRSDFLPQGQRVRVGDPFPEGSSSTAYLQNWRRVRLAVAGVGTVAMVASSEFVHLALHQAGSYTCIEAVSHVANGFNLAASGVEGTGARLLAPGETLAGSIALTIGDDG